MHLILVFLQALMFCFDFCITLCANGSMMFSFQSLLPLMLLLLGKQITGGMRNIFIFTIVDIALQMSVVDGNILRGAWGLNQLSQRTVRHLGQYISSDGWSLDQTAQWIF